MLEEWIEFIKWKVQKRDIWVLIPAFFIIIVSPFILADDLPNTAGTLINNNFSNTLESFTDNITWVLQAGSTLYVDGHDNDANGAIYFGTTTPYYELNETPEDIDTQMSFFWELAAMCNSTSTDDKTLITHDGGNDVIVFELDTTDTEMNPVVRDEQLNTWNPGTVSGATLVGDKFSYHAIARNCTGSTCDLTYYYNGTALAWDNSTAVDGDFSGLATDWFLGDNSGQTRSAENCSISHFRHVLNENLTPENASDNYALMFVPSGVDLGDDLQVFWRFEDDTEGEFNTTVGDNDTFSLVELDDSPGDIPNQSYGFFDEGLYFNGIDDGLRTTAVNNGIGGAFQGVTEYGFSLWVKAFNKTGGHQVLLYHDTTSLGNSDAWIIMIRTNGSIYWSTTHNRAPLGGTPDEVYTSVTDVFDENWHNIIFSVDPLGGDDFRKTLYFDGTVLVNQTWTTTHGTQLLTHWTTFGRSPNGHQNQYLNGWLDEVVLWSGGNAYITQDEATTIYNSGRGTDPVTNTSNDLLTINYTNGTNQGDLLNYNITVSITTNDISVSWDSFNTSEDMGFRSLSSINMTGLVNNVSNMSFTVFPNESASHGDVKSLQFYDQISLEVNFEDQTTSADVDNVSLEIVGTASYTNNTVNSTINTIVNMDEYDLTATSNISDYSTPTSLSDQNLTNLSTISGTMPLINLTMFFLNVTASGSSNITAEVFDQAGQRVEDAQINVYRFDIDLNNFVLVQQASTDFQGEARFQATLFTEVYRFDIFLDGDLVASTSQDGDTIKDTTLRFVIDTRGPIGEGFFTVSDLTYTLIEGEIPGSLRHIFTWFTASANITEFCLDSFIYHPIAGRTLQNSSCLTTSSGSITHNLVNQSNVTWESRAYVTYVDEYKTVDTIYSSFPETNPMGTMGIFLLLALSMVFIFVGRWHPELPLVLVPLAWVLAGFARLHPFPLWVTVPILILGFIFAGWINRK